jgi:hypothetical protein
MLGHRDLAETRQWTPQWPFTATDNPLDEINFVGNAFMIQTDFLEIVEQTFF